MITKEAITAAAKEAGIQCNILSFSRLCDEAGYEGTAPSEVWFCYTFDMSKTTMESPDASYIAEGEYDAIAGYYGDNKDDLAEAVSQIREKAEAERERSARHA